MLQILGEECVPRVKIKNKNVKRICSDLRKLCDKAQNLGKLTLWELTAN